MPLHFQEIDVDLPVSDWGILLAQMPANDFIVVDDNRDRLIWFTTNYTQLLARNGGTEIAPIYGELANDHSSFVYQVNFSLPCSYKLGDNPHALYDLLLNFETEPDRRYIIWNDTQHLHRLNSPLFEEIFESMLVAAYCNRNGISTIKEDNTPYRVDQRNIFLFNKAGYEAILPLLTKEYYILGYYKQFEKELDFNVISLKSDYFDDDLFRDIDMDE